MSKNDSKKNLKPLLYLIGFMFLFISLGSLFISHFIVLLSKHVWLQYFLFFAVFVSIIGLIIYGIFRLFKKVYLSIKDFPLINKLSPHVDKFGIKINDKITPHTSKVKNKFEINYNEKKEKALNLIEPAKAFILKNMNKLEFLNNFNPKKKRD